MDASQIPGNRAVTRSNGVVPTPKGSAAQVKPSQARPTPSNSTDPAIGVPNQSAPVK